VFARDAKNPEMWRARADLYEQLERFGSGYSDLEKAVELLGPADLDRGHVIRYQLVRLLVRWNSVADAEYGRLDELMSDWRKGLAAGDLPSGYMLVEYLSRSPSADLATTLERMRILAPDDQGVVMALVRVYRQLGKDDLAVAELHALAERDPTRKPEIDKLVIDIRTDREKRKKYGWTNEEIPDPELHGGHGPGAPKLPMRLGVRLGFGNGVRGAAEGAMTIGVFATPRISRGVAFVARLDWSQRTTNMSELDAFAVSTGVSIHVLSTKRAILALGAAQRTEARWGPPVDRGAWGALGLAGDLTIDLIGRKLPGSIGARLEQSLSEKGRNTSAFVEMTLELR
jgi:hypothetical protein